MKFQDLTKTDKSILLYMETRIVDFGGFLDGNKMNQADLESAHFFKTSGVIEFGRIPAKLLEAAKPSTYWVTFTNEAWELAHALRRERSLRPSPARQVLDEYLTASNA
ncbi:hypothetical protein R6242_21335 [Iodobacter sp. CM08]|uniref:hypothetical protein n=1 Tax=Iodobacter sp. CM08 TaxID=3085902 RepID=UPI002981C1B8|nr:hypothetical protein [Iodobacter sp. CM08]MDW5419120.1 hypothetical protein [Iodobacter sp. CM08]